MTQTIPFRVVTQSRVLRAALLAAAMVWFPLASGLAADRLDVNQATVEQLATLPGIGPAKAAAIVDERTRKPFTSVDDLERVKGIGPALIAQLRDHVVAAPSQSQ